MFRAPAFGTETCIEAIEAALGAGRPPVYEDFHRGLAMAGQSNDIRTREAFLRLFNTYGAPLLTRTEAALQFLCMHTDYLYLRPGMRLHMHATHDLFGVPQTDYAEEMYVEDRFVDPNHGGVVTFYAPDRGAFPNGRLLVVPHGTAANRARDVMAVNLPTGMRADIDVAGIGHKFVEHNAPELLRRVRRVLDQGRRVTFAGHSLGGVLSLLLLGNLSPDEQRVCTARTYNAPALSLVGARRLVWPSNILMVRAPFDLATYAGMRHPAAAAVYPRPRRRSWSDCLFGHGVPQLAQQQLDGLPLSFKLEPYVQGDTFCVIETGRKALGHLAYDRIEA